MDFHRSARPNRRRAGSCHGAPAVTSRNLPAVAIVVPVVAAVIWPVDDDATRQQAREENGCENRLQLAHWSLLLSRPLLLSCRCMSRASPRPQVLPLKYPGFAPRLPPA